MRDDILSVINDELDKISDDSDNLVDKIDEMILKQNKMVADRDERRKIIKAFLKSNKITSIDELSDDVIKNIMNYKI